MDSTQYTLMERILRASFRHKPVVLLVVTLAFIFGAAAYQRMPKNVYPDITIPVFTIVTENEAMAPEEIELMITRPMEAAMNGLPGVRRVRSQTTQGLSSVIVDFDIETEFWRARQFVSERIAQVAAQLPPGTEPPTLASATTRLAEVYEFAVEGDISAMELRELAEWNIRYTLLTVPGVAEVLNMGGYLRQYRITLNPARIHAHGVTLAEVETAIRSGNENASGGFISTGSSEYTVRGIGRYDSLQDIGDTVIGEKNGVPLFLRDVAVIEDSTAIRRGIASKNGKETVVALVIKQPAADTVQVVQGIEKAIEDMRPTLPKGVHIVPYYDQTHLIRHALTSVARAILIGAVLVVLVLFAYLGHLRSTLIVAISLPLSVGIAAILMRQFNVGLNTLSLGGLAIAIGIMVDASIIMVENMFHHFHHHPGEIHDATAKERIAFRAALEVGRPIAFATFIIVAVFLPLFLMSGIEGLLFRPLAVTVGSAMMVSLILSLTLTPVLCLWLLASKRSQEKAVEAWLVRWLKKGYVPILNAALRRQGLVIAATILLLIPAGFGLSRVGRDFMPELDEGAWVISTVTPPETSLEQNDRITRRIEQLLMSNPNITDVVRRNGRSERAIGCVLPVNAGEIIVNLKPKEQLSRPVADILADIREAVEEIPGVAAAFTQPLQLKMDESMEGTSAPLQVKLFGPDIQVLTEHGKAIFDIVRNTPGIEDAKMDQAVGVPQLQIQIDREAAARYGVSAAALSEIVRLAIGGEELTQVWKNQRSYGVFARFPEEIRNSPEAIGAIMVDTPAGNRIPLSQVAQITLREGPNVIWREAMNRRLSIDAGIQGRDLGSVVKEIKTNLARINLPPDYFVVFGGQYESQQRAMRSLALATGVALIIVFILLYLALHSLSQAAIILATVPSAFIGGVVSLLMMGETLNVSSAVGFIALFGIAVQNSLVLLTQTNDFIAEGHAKLEAVRLASVQRLRPKLMTASCAALGLLPILLSQGVGAEIEKPLAIVMMGGLISSTLFTLLVLPAVYIVKENFVDALHARRS